MLDSILKILQIIALIGGFVVLLRRIKSIHLMMNSRLDELLKSTATASRAEGIEEGRKEDRQ